MRKFHGEKLKLKKSRAVNIFLNNLYFHLSKIRNYFFTISFVWIPLCVCIFIHYCPTKKHIRGATP
jgi:hypothetical protein